MHLHHCRCFQEHVRMLLHSLRELCKAPGGAGSIWKYLEALARATGLSGRFAYGFRIELRFADAFEHILKVLKLIMTFQRELAVVNMQTPGHQNEFIDCPTANVWITVLPIVNVKTLWNSTFKLLEGAFESWECTREWLKNSQYGEYWALCTTQVEWTIVEYLIDVSRPFWY